MNNDEFGLRLKNLRQTKAEKLGRRKIPQREVAEKLGVTHGSYASWEIGRTKPDIASLPKIASYFDVSIDFLLGYESSIRTHLDRQTNQSGIEWSLRRPIHTKEEEMGVEIWCQLCKGGNFEEIGFALDIGSGSDVKSYLMDVIYTDMININRLPEDYDLAEKVRQTFNLEEVIVIRKPVDSPNLLGYILLGEASRLYFKGHIHKRRRTKVGIAGGYAVSQMVYSLRPGDCLSPIELYPLATSPAIQNVGLDANTLVGVMEYRHRWHHVDGYFLQYARPYDLQRVENHQSFGSTLSVLAKAKSIDIAFMGLGNFDKMFETINWIGNLHSRGLEIDTVRAQGAVGDILYHIVDQHGQPIPSEIDEYVCGIGLEDLQKMIQRNVRVVAIASGANKAQIARAAIKGKYINGLIITSELALALLEAKEK